MKKILLVLLLSSLAWAETTPSQVVDSFYRTYTEAVESAPRTWVQTTMAKEAAHIESDLSAMLVDLANGDPNTGGPWLDFDPFSNSQMGVESYSLGETTLKGGLAYVPVSIKFPRDPGPARLRLRVVLRQSEGAWKIANFVYPAEAGMAAWDLRGYLKETLKR
ncbi:MAG: DUF3828 domain-containing protein [Candidatus Eremiobacteraeota bacterium]|nr:DUF3828 domain-containing protein [Candidatus Eremiobacteraeota bacterium]